MRKFIRHPSSIPIELAIGPVSAGRAHRLRDIGSGGFACAVAEPVAIGSVARLRIPLLWPDYSGCGVVVWCRSAPPCYEVGVEFAPQDLLKTGMAEQFCQIERYRQEVLSEEGRELDSEQAAEELIALHAMEFSGMFAAPGRR